MASVKIATLLIRVSKLANYLDLQFHDSQTEIKGPFSFLG
jgi:hypothetical protein